MENHAALPVSFLRRHGVGVTCARFSSPAQLLSGDEQGRILIWDLRELDAVGELRSVSSSLPATGSSFSPAADGIQDIVFPPLQEDSRSAASQCVVQTRQGRLELWDVGTRSCLTFLDTKTTALAHVCGVGKNAVKALQLPSSSNFLCATTSKAHDAVNVYEVLGSSRRGKPVIETTPLSSAQVPGLPFVSHTVTSPGWIAGIQPAAKLGPTYLLLAYEAFGVQALYDMRKPSSPVTTPAVFPHCSETTVSFSVSRNQSWIGTSEGHILVSKLKASGEIVTVDALDAFTQCRDSEDVAEDPLEFTREMINSLTSKSKLGIGALCFTPCSRVVLAGCWDAHWRCIDVLTRHTFDIMRFHSDAISSIDVDPETQRIAVASRDSRISLWQPWW